MPQQNHLCNFGRSHHEEEFCEIILNLDEWFRERCCSKIFLICSSGAPLFGRSGTICATLVEGIMRNNSVDFFQSGPAVQEEMSYKDISCV